MAALVFPPSPVPGQLFPDPPLPGVAQWEWDATTGAWNARLRYVALNNQTAYNSYVWPNADGGAGTQLETDGSGNLTWGTAGVDTFLVLDIQGTFDGVQSSFALIDPITTNIVTPTPPSNLQVFLGGVAQNPLTAYTIAGSIITFTQAPLAGTSFFALTLVEN